MTEKRFKLDSEIGFIDTQKCGGDAMTLFEVVVELNKLNEENEKLKQNCKNYEWYKQYKAVLNENEQLKKDFDSCSHNWALMYNEAKNKVGELSERNEQLKKVLGAILLEVKRDITNTNQTGEIKVFINPNSFDLISEVLREYGALRGEGMND